MPPASTINRADETGRRSSARSLPGGSRSGASPDVRIQRAVHNILTRTFSLRRDQNLLILVGQQSLEVVEIVARTAHALRVGVTALFVPRALEAEIGPDENLPLPTEAAIREADAVLSCLSAEHERSNYWTRVLHTSWSRRAKLAHAPGLTADLLRLADVDYSAIAERAGQLALALILGKRLELVTTDKNRREHRLNVRIGGWERPPGINDGVLRDGSWGSLPPGKVYIVPEDAEGHLVVNGALPGRIFGPDEELLLTFRAGRLTAIAPEDCPAAHCLHETQIAYAERRGDVNWAHLGEVGFGLNPAVQALTGISAVDEKKANTVHVGLGHNTDLGGEIESAIHCDMIIKKPTVYINGRPILKRGDWRVNDADWRLDHRIVAVPAGWWEALARFGRSGVRTELEGGRLVCSWNAGSGRWDRAVVGNEATARLAARAYALLPETGNVISKEELLARAAQASIPATALPGLFWVLQQFDVVRLLTTREAAAWAQQDDTVRISTGGLAGRRPIGPV